jgi:hypothetical protein
MNPTLIAQLVDVAISVAKSQLQGKEVQDALVGIIQTGVQAYEEHAGQPFDLSLIRPEDPV